MASDAANMKDETNDKRNDRSKNWYAYYRFKPGRDSPSDARNTLLVVATLIAAVTFQAGVNPPGGVWQETSESHTAGKSILSSHSRAASPGAVSQENCEDRVAGTSILGCDSRAYTVFIFTNTLAYASAVQIIFVLVIGCPFRTEVWIALLSMTCTYGASIASVQPSGVVSPGFLFITAFIPCILRLALQTLRWFQEEKNSTKGKKYFGSIC